MFILQVWVHILMEASAFPSINPLVLGLTGGTQGWSMGSTGGSDKWLLTKWYCCASTRLLISAGLTPQMTFQNVACIPHHNRILVFLSHAALTNHSWQFTYVPWSTGLGTGGGFSLDSQGCFLHHHCPYPDPPSKVRTPSLLCIPSTPFSCSCLISSCQSLYFIKNFGP